MNVPDTATRFQLEECVARGAMGEIHRATDTQTGQTIAVKFLREHATPEDSARFQREVRILADLRHPGIVGYVDHGVWENGRPYIAMEWLEGEDLGKRERREPLGLSDAVEVVRRTAQAMAAIHARGVIHRDLKLSNIYLVHGNISKGVKLIDFGVVKLPTPDEYQTQPGSIIGTPHFMAPEQARGDKVTPRADVFSLGAVLFRLVTGRHMFEADHIIAFLGRLVLEDAPRVRSIRFDVPELLDALIARTLSRDPSQRPPDAGELARWLARMPAMNNDPPQSEQSASAVRSIPETKPEDFEDETAVTETVETSTTGIEPARRERRIIAVVVAAVPPEGLPQEILDQTKAVLAPDASLQPLQGGKLVAALGLARTTGDEVVRAARAALVIATTVPGARVAVGAGHAVAGRRRGLAGEALDRTAKQLEKTAPGGVRLDPATRPLLQGRFVARFDEDGGVLLHEDIAAERPPRLLGKKTHTIGRKNEMALLMSTFADVITDGSPRGVLITGSPGIGKTRLRHEMLRRVRKRFPDIGVLIARGDPVQSRPGLSVLGRALRSRMGIRDGERRTLQIERVIRYCQQHIGDESVESEFLGEFVGVAFPDSYSGALQAARGAPRLMNARILQALETLVRSDARRAPQMVVLEDVHLIDPTSLAAIEWLLGSEDQLHMFVLGMARDDDPEMLRHLWSKQSVTHIRLGPLPASACKTLVERTLPHTTDEQVLRLVERSEGNALFLEELIRNAAAGRDDLPISVQALIQTRLDKLSVRQRAVIRAASVFGRQCWTDGVSSLLDRDCSDDLEALAELELLSHEKNSRIEGQHEWLFPQAAVFETAYSSLVESDRKTLHLAASEWLLIAGEEDIGTIARHAEAGGDMHRAAALYVRASAQAYSNGQLESALSFASSAIDMTDEASVRIQALLQQAQAFAWMGRFQSQLEAAETAASLAKTGENLWCNAQRLSAAALRELGQPSRAEERFSWTVRRAEGMGRVPLADLALLHTDRAGALLDLGLGEQALSSGNKARDLAQQEGADHVRTLLRAQNAIYAGLSATGACEEAIETAYALLQQAEQIGDVVIAAWANIDVGTELVHVGLFEEAARYLEQAVRDAQVLKMRTAEGFARSHLGMCLARLGDMDTGVTAEQQALAIGQETSHFRLTLEATLNAARIRTMRGAPGDLREAWDMAEACVSDSVEFPVLHVQALGTLAQTHLSRRDIKRTVRTFQQAMSEAVDLQSFDATEEILRVSGIEALLQARRQDLAIPELRRAFAFIISRAEQLETPEHKQRYLLRRFECARILELSRDLLNLKPPPQIASLLPGY